MLASNVVCATQRTAKLDEAEVSGGAFLDEETGPVDEYSDAELEIIEQCRKQTVRLSGRLGGAHRHLEEDCGKKDFLFYLFFFLKKK